VKKSSNKSIKLGAGWKNLCKLNDFKENHKILFQIEINLLNNEIRFISLLQWSSLLHNYLLLLNFLKICISLLILEQFIYLHVLFMFMHSLYYFIMFSCLFIRICSCLFFIY